MLNPGPTTARAVVVVDLDDETTVYAIVSGFGTACERLLALRPGADPMSNETSTSNEFASADFASFQHDALTRLGCNYLRVSLSEGLNRRAIQ